MRRFCITIVIALLIVSCGQKKIEELKSEKGQLENKISILENEKESLETELEEMRNDMQAIRNYARQASSCASAAAF